MGETGRFTFSGAFGGWESRTERHGEQEESHTASKIKVKKKGDKRLLKKCKRLNRLVRHLGRKGSVSKIWGGDEWGECM